MHKNSVEIEKLIEFVSDMIWAKILDVFNKSHFQQDVLTTN